MFNYSKYFVILLLMNRCQSYNFIILANEGFFKPCDASDNLGNVNMADVLQFNLRHEYANDMETLITNGNITVKADLSASVFLRLSMEVLSWKRGKWETTMYSIRRQDLCSALFDPTELWYSLTRSIPEEDRNCPPQKGTAYHLDEMKNRIELHDVNVPDLEGQYKVITHISTDTHVTCVSSIVDIWKN